MISETPVTNIQVDASALLEHFGLLFLEPQFNSLSLAPGTITYIKNKLLLSGGFNYTPPTNLSSDEIGTFYKIFEGSTPEGFVSIKYRVNGSGLTPGVYLNFNDPYTFTYMDNYYPIAVADATVPANTTTPYTIKVQQENQLDAGDVIILYKNNWVTVKKSQNNYRSSKLCTALVITKTDATEVIVQNVYLTPYLTTLQTVTTHDILNISKASDIDYDKIKIQELITLGIVSYADN